MHSCSCADKDHYRVLLNSHPFTSRYRFLCHLAEIHRKQTSFTIPGMCEVCNLPVDFLTDHQCGMRIEHGFPWPNWRERQVCPRCGLASRQRMAFGFMRDALARRAPSQDFTLYMMEMVTPIFGCAQQLLPGITLIGSEYLGPGIQGGRVVRGVRHEDVCQLSLADESVDLVVSNDVMEHVPDPKAGFGEIFRVLRRGGILFLTIPFHSGNETTVVRAEVHAGKVIHHLPAAYHGNPVSPEGSLVYMDFGWDVLSMLRAAGFARVEVKVIWSYLYGHLGIPMEYFSAAKP
jgi:hypothetical protein